MYGSFVIDALSSNASGSSRCAPQEAIKIADKATAMQTAHKARRSFISTTPISTFRISKVLKHLTSIYVLRCSVGVEVVSIVGIQKSSDRGIVEACLQIVQLSIVLVEIAISSAIAIYISHGNIADDRIFHRFYHCVLRNQL